MFVIVLLSLYFAGLVITTPKLKTGSAHGFDQQLQEAVHG